MIRIASGKGSKERLVPASPRLLQALRDYWKIDRPSNYLFPGRTPDVPLSSATIQKACKLAAAKAGIRKTGVSPHTMRHTFATSMLEAGVDLLTISKLLGHASFITTMIYLHIRRQNFERSPSPLDWMPTRQCPKWIDPTLPNSIDELNKSPLEENPPPAPPAKKAQRRTSGAKPKRRRPPRHE